MIRKAAVLATIIAALTLTPATIAAADQPLCPQSQATTIVPQPALDHGPFFCAA